MSADERLIELWNDYLEGELDRAGIIELQQLFANDERFVQMAADNYRTHRLLGLLAQDSDSQQDDFVRETLNRLPAKGDQFVGAVMRRIPPGSSTTARSRVAKWSKSTFLQFLLAAAAILIVALSVGLYIQWGGMELKIAEEPERPLPLASDSSIARISGLSGALAWTGDRGQVQRELNVGSKLDGGTIEGESPDSWFELEFNDGSTAMIAGTSTLTFSDFGQKELHLRRGSLSASVVPQPDGKPMLIHTRSAVLKVLGTRFEVEAELDSTAIHVSEGRVQVKRLSDGRTIDVLANHRVLASADGDMSAAPIPDVVHDWKSRLHLGPTDVSGKWLPPTGARPAALKAIPFVPLENKTIRLHLAGLAVNRADNAPVVVRTDSRFVVRGRMQVTAELYFGIQVARQNGGFAGKFLARQLVKTEDSIGDFEAVFHLDEFGLDPIVWDRKDELPSKPDDLVVTSVWAFTHTGEPTGLEVTEVALIPTDDGVSFLSNNTEDRR